MGWNGCIEAGDTFHDLFYRALLRRDAAFDGRFFACVRTTGVYCRSICPAPKPKQENCVFVPRAKDARRFGFRPCLRCRPETAPGSPAWAGTAATVTRGLRLIEAGYLDRNGVADLADVLGIGARHLSRLFARHVGTSPRELANARRVQAAKFLVVGSDLPMTQIAFEAGFSSVRRFNDAFVRAYDCAPSALRRAGT